MGQQSGQTLAGSSAQDVTRLIRLLPEVWHLELGIVFQIHQVAEKIQFFEAVELRPLATWDFLTP